MTIEEVVVWVIIGALAGSLAGMVMTRSKRGYGPLTNILIGLVGAVIGGFLFDTLNIDLNLGQLEISYDQVVAAFVGGVVLLGLVGYLRKR